MPQSLHTLERQMAPRVMPLTAAELDDLDDIEVAHWPQPGEACSELLADPPIPSLLSRLWRELVALFNVRGW